MLEKVIVISLMGGIVYQTLTMANMATESVEAHQEAQMERIKQFKHQHTKVLHQQASAS